MLEKASEPFVCLPLSLFVGSRQNTCIFPPNAFNSSYGAAVGHIQRQGGEHIGR